MSPVAPARCELPDRRVQPTVHERIGVDHHGGRQHRMDGPQRAQEFAPLRAVVERALVRCF